MFSNSKKVNFTKITTGAAFSILFFILAGALIVMSSVSSAQAGQTTKAAETTSISKSSNDEFSSFVKARESKKLPAIIKEYIKNISAPAVFMEISKLEKTTPPQTITKQQALEDIEMIKYLFDNAYSGKEYWENNGVDFASMYNKLNEYANKNESVEISALESIICESLSEISDGHLSIEGSGRYSFFKHNDAYFADLLIEKNGNEYSVIKSNEDAVQPGAKFIDSEKLLFKTLSAPSRQHYLIGKLSRKYIQNLKVKFDSGAQSIRLHNCKISSPCESNDIFTVKEIDGVTVLKVSSFGSNHDEKLRQYSQYGSKLRGEPHFILDLRFNGGGSSRYSEEFFKNLNTTAHWLKAGGVLNSPPTAQSWANDDYDSAAPFLKEMILEARELVKKLKKEPSRTWDLFYDNMVQQMGDYKGKSIIISNRKVASSGEATIAYSKSVSGNIVVGENSGGVGTFGEVLTYMLKNSKIYFNLPSKLFLSPQLKEGSGYMPDLWLDSSEPAVEIVKWLKQGENYQFELEPKPVLHNLNFEKFVNGRPEHMTTNIGAYISNENKTSLIEQDNKVFIEGLNSLKLSADAATAKFYALSCKVPDGHDKITAAYSVRGHDIKQEGKQFNNCYIGFIYKNNKGETIFNIKEYSGNFDWKKDSITLDIKKERAGEIKFSIFKCVSGSLWIDDIKFKVD